MSAVNPALAANLDSRPKKVVLLPPQIFVYELSAGGVPTRMGEWEARARSNANDAARQAAHETGVFELLDAPAFDAADQETLDAHIGLYDRVAQSVFVYGRGEQSAWAHKKNEFDYTVGPGLAFLRARTGADAALIVLGADLISSSSRKLAFVAGLALGVIMPLGQSFVAAGLVDLDTGDVQWMSFESSSSLDTRDPDDVKDLMRAFYQTWPGAR
ncbi:MAG: hypothetical protein AB1593_02855 [Pseudomonadota bacterium]